ncbi:hypothetical protein Tco_1088614 [Tanacetum coccineum]
MPYDSPLPGGYTPGSVEVSMKLKELTDLCTKLVARVTSLETELKKTKEVHGKALTKLVKKVKVQSQETFEAELRVLSAAKILVESSKERVKTYNRRRGSTDSSQVSTAAGLVSTAEDIQDTDEEQTKALEQQEQERANLEAALKLQKQFDQERKEADNIDWNKIVKQVQERQSGSMIRYQALKKKPVTVAQARKNMMVYLKNMANYKMSYFKVAEEALLQESFKKLRTSQALGSEAFQEQSTEETKEFSEEDLKTLLEIVPSLKNSCSNITEAYQSFEDMLKAFDREDLDTLWSLVKEKFGSVEPTEDMERALWVELKRLYEPDNDDTLWKLQRYMHDPLTWRFYDVDAQKKIARKIYSDWDQHQHSGPTTNVADEAVNEEMDDSLERAVTTATSLDAEQDSGVDTPRSDEDSLNLKELMELCTNLQNRVIDLEKTKTSQAQEITSLKRRVKRLEKKGGSRTHRLKRLYKVGLSRRVESSDEEGLGEEDVSKQGRKIDDIDVDEGITLVDETAENQGRFNDEEMFDTGVLDDEEVFAEQEVAAKDLTVDEVTLAQALAALKSTKPKAKGIVFRKPGESTTTTIPIPLKIQDKGKAKMIEPEPVKKLSKKDQLMLDEELAFKLQVEEEEEKERLAREKAQQVEEVNIA